MTWNTIAASLARWEGHKKKYFFQLFSKKSQFSTKIKSLKMTSQKNLIANITDAINSRFRIVNWFFEILLGTCQTGP